MAFEVLFVVITLRSVQIETDEALASAGRQLRLCVRAHFLDLLPAALSRSSAPRFVFVATIVKINYPSD